jgi:predicted small secreted protein
MIRLATAVIAASIVFIAGCNTIAGAGEDVSATGKAVTNAADKSKPN